MAKQWVRTWGLSPSFYVYSPHPSGHSSNPKCLGLPRHLAALQRFFPGVSQMLFLPAWWLPAIPAATTAPADKAILLFFLSPFCQVLPHRLPLFPFFPVLLVVCSLLLVPCPDLMWSSLTKGKERGKHYECWWGVETCSYQLEPTGSADGLWPASHSGCF